MSWQEFIKAVSQASFEFPWQRPLIIAQAILESGRGTTDLSFYKNMNGMKYRESIAIPGAEKIKYYTESERNNPDGPGWDWFFKFDTYETGIKVWQKLFFRKEGNWIPYPKVYERNPEVLKDACAFLTYVGPIYCPFFEQSHSESYADYILNRCFPEAERLLRESGITGPSSTTRLFKVAIMPGHGGYTNSGHPGYDPGACNEHLHITESEFNWREAQEVKRLLEQDGNFQVTICRSQAEDLPLEEYQSRANNTSADLCLCLHHNSSDRREAKGWWLFASKQDSKTDQLLKDLEKHFRELPLQARGCTYATPPFTGDRGWLKRVWNCIHACTMPTVLVEGCFISNDQDCQWLKDGGYQQIAQKICDGIREYLGSSLQPYSAIVQDSEPPLNVRSGPGTQHSILTQLPNGTLLTVDDDNGNGWLHITIPIAGYVSKSRTKRAAPSSDILYKATVNDPNPPLNVRSGPGTQYPIVGTVQNGTTVEVVENNQQGWLRVQSPLPGWVANHLIERLDHPSLPSAEIQTHTQARSLHLVRTNKPDEYGCKWLILSIHNGDFQPIESINVVSGIPSCQVFEIGSPQNRPGCCYPLPQGEYAVSTEVAWAGGRENYNASFGAGLGPVWVAIMPKFRTSRRDFGFHLDPNRLSSPGTAGCIGFTSLADLKRFVAWFANPNTAPHTLKVDWGLTH
jgi:N-acetylmuramoyl-L-alanine amidase/uncharacterized protein YraI